MVTVMRQKSFHKPNGNLEARKKAKGCGGKQLVVFPDIKPFKAKGRWKTKTMKELYAEVPRFELRSQRLREARKLRRKLAKMKMPMPEGREDNPKKNRSDRRPRRVEWPSEKNPAPRYRYDGSIKYQNGV
jgi:hypothetical protein